MHALFFWFTLSFVIGGSSLPDSGIAASSAYVRSTEGLDLHHVRLAVAAPPEFTSRLSGRAGALFAKAGLPLGNSDGADGPFTAALTLTLSPQPLTDTCLGHVLYVPSLRLTEPVIISRNGELLNDVTWLTHTGAQVREPMTISDLERDLDTFIEQFIADYRAANAGVHSLDPERAPMISRADSPPPVSVAAEHTAAHSNAGLKELPTEQLLISVSAGRYSQALTKRALQQFSAAGRPLMSGLGRNKQVSLGVELTQQTLEDRCPGKVLYESGLYLVEQVQIGRNRQVSIWSDTWMRETIAVVTPRTQAQLESDQDALLRQFIDALNTR